MPIFRKSLRIMEGMEKAKKLNDCKKCYNHTQHFKTEPNEQKELFKKDI